jgi:hypothetical protein
MRIRRLASLDNPLQLLLPRSIYILSPRKTIRHILKHCSIEQRWFLLHDPNIRPQPPHIKLADINAIK